VTPLLDRLESARESLSIAGAAASPNCEASQTCSIRPSRWRGWFVTLVVEFEMPTTKVPVREPEAVGFDMVLEPPNFLVGSDGGEVRAPRYYRARERKLRRAQKHLSRTKRDSRNRIKARRRVAKIHERTAICAKTFCISCPISSWPHGL
jgi:hypothetical protein